MRILTIISIIFCSNLSFAQWKIGPKDPCYTDFKSSACLDQIRSKIFFMSSVTGEPRAEETSYVNEYFKRHGVQGFYGPNSQYHPDGSLFEYAINDSKNAKFNKKLMESLPIGEKLYGKNIFAMAITHAPFTRSSDMQNYIENLKVLFPKEENENFQKTKEKFGLPWDDPSFAQKYLEQINSVINEIDRHNDFFKKHELLPQRKQLVELKERVEVLANMPKKACELNKIEEYQEFKVKYGELYRSSTVDIIDCLMKQEKYELAKAIIKEGDYEQSKLPSYFDQAVALKETPEAFDYAKFLYSEMSKTGQKINPKKGETKRDFLQRGSQYLHKYHQEDEIICEIDFGTGSSAVDELTKDLNMILFLEAYELMEKILAETDEMKKNKLIDQFLDLKNVGNSLGLKHPTKGNSILHLIGEAGDFELYTKLEGRGVSSSLMGYEIKDANGNTPVIAAIKKAGPGNLKFAGQYLKYFGSYKAEELSEMLKAIKKVKTDSKELKDLKKQLKWSVKEEMWDAY